MNRTKIVITVLVAWLAITAIGMVRGCSSAALPPPPSPSEMTLVRATHFPVTVGVEAYRWPVYSERLVDSLRKTGLFDAVAPLDRLQDATLIARVDRPITGTATIPLFTALSFGLIPTTVQESWGEAFSLYRNGASESGVAVDFSYSGPSTLGWWAAVRSLSRDITTAHPRKTVRFYDALSVAICRKADEIRALTPE
jgi:hypothetical protein